MGDGFTGDCCAGFSSLLMWIGDLSSGVFGELCLGCDVRVARGDGRVW